MEPNRTLHLTQGALIQLAKGDGKTALRPFSMLAYSGASVVKFGADVVFNLAGMKISNVMPILKNHDPEQIVGQSVTVQKTETELRVNGTVSKVTEAAREVSDLSDEGFQWQASTGLIVGDVTFVAEGNKVSVNGREFNGPCYVVNTSELRECSFCPAGADPNTSGVVLSFSELANASPACGLGKNSKEVVMPEDPKMTAPVNAEKIAAEASANAAQGERGRFAALSAKFPQHPQFVAEQFGKGATVEQAEVSFKDVLLAEKEAEIAALKNSAAQPAPAPKATGADPKKFSVQNANGGEPAPAGGDFMAQASARAAERKCSMTQAMTELSTEQPELHASYVAGIQPVARQRR